MDWFTSPTGSKASSSKPLRCNRPKRKNLRFVQQPQRAQGVLYNVVCTTPASVSHIIHTGGERAAVKRQVATMRNNDKVNTYSVIEVK
jgi:hypothetical protein